MALSRDQWSISVQVQSDSLTDDAPHQTIHDGPGPYIAASHDTPFLLHNLTPESHAPQLNTVLCAQEGVLQRRQAMAPVSHKPPAPGVDQPSFGQHQGPAPSLSLCPTPYGWSRKALGRSHCMPALNVACSAGSRCAGAHSVLPTCAWFSVV